MIKRLACWFVVLNGVFVTFPDAMAEASEEAALRELLGDFLEGAATLEAHERFWADDLVYTSSSGTRTNKAEILAGMQAAASAEQPGPDSDVVYSAEDVDIRVYDHAAVIAFRLVAGESKGAAPVDEYFNTGTFLNRDGVWRAVAWQATHIPDGDSGVADDQEED